MSVMSVNNNKIFDKIVFNLRDNPKCYFIDIDGLKFYENKTKKV